MEKIERAWGTYEVLLDEPNYKVKRLTFNPNSSISRQYHRYRNEEWTIVEGNGIMQLESKISGYKQVRELQTNDSCYIPKFHWHRFTSDNCKTVVIEVWLGSSTEEDIVRE